jgi:hypothetical protein
MFGETARAKPKLRMIHCGVARPFGIGRRRVLRNNLDARRFDFDQLVKPLPVNSRCPVEVVISKHAIG